MEDFKNKILYWAEVRGLLKEENQFKQALKLGEESGELFSAILKNNREEQIDAIGDIDVVIEILCAQLNIDRNEARKSAYNEIKDRRGQNVGGTFIKE